MKVLITGGLGFVGSNVAAACIARGDTVLVYDNKTRAGADANAEWLKCKGEYSFAHADVRDREKVIHDVATFNPDGVLHFAGQVAMATSLEDPVGDFETNAVGTLNVLEAIRRNVVAGRRDRVSMAYASTNKVYGDLENTPVYELPTRYELSNLPYGFSEQISLDFRTPYGCSKGSADQMVLDYSRRIPGLNGCVFRHSTIYGPRQFATETQGWVGWFCDRALDAATGQGREFTVSGNGKQVRDLLYVDDVVRLYLAALDEPDRVAGQAYNIGGGTTCSLSILELLERLESLTGATLTRKHIAWRESDQRVFIADTRKIQRDLNWTPLVGIDFGLREMMRWVATLRDESGC